MLLKPEGSQMQSDDDRIKAYIDSLAQAGIDPRTFAAIVSQFAGSTQTPTGGSDNVPGFEYVQRVSNAALQAMLAHGEEANRAWSEIRRGRFGIGAAMQSWTKVVENYACVVMEGLRFTAHPPQPAWLFIPYSKGRPTTQFSIRMDTLREQASDVESTKFESPGPLGSAAAPRQGTVTSSLYKKTPKVVDGRIEFSLDPDLVKELENDTMHTALVFRKGRGATPPVAVIVMRVTA
jgi:hypothetical protein